MDPLFSLLSQAPDDHNLSFGAISLLTFEAVMQAVIICVAGYTVARLGLLTAAGQKVISRINVDLFTPCLVFTKLASSLSVNKLDDMLIIPIFFALLTGISYLCSRATSRLMRLNAAESDFVTAMGIFGNSNSLPVSLTLALAYTLPDLLWDQIADDDSDKVASRGMLYLIIFQQLGQVLRWSWGFNTLLRKRLYAELTADHPPSATPAETTRLLEAEPFGSDRVPSPARLYLSELDDVHSTGSGAGSSSSSIEAHVLVHKPPRPGSWVARKWHRFCHRRPVRAFLRFMNPPLYAMALSIVVATVPALQRMFFEQGTFVNLTVTQSVKQLGLVSIPLILIVMGLNLAPSKDMPSASRHYKKMVFASLLSRMILPSFVLLPVIAASVKYINISILDDPIFLIVAFILTILPPAIQLSQITQLNNVYEKEMAGVLFWGYVVVTLPTTIFIVVASLEVLKWAV